jgi:hypothetical protein
MKEISPKKLFLLDSAGALLTAILLGFILPRWENIFGMSPMVLYFLSFIASIYFVYSFWCYFRLKHNWKPYLKAIALANLLYCGITLGLAVYLRAELTTFGWAYFLLEAVVITSLAIFELKTAYRLKPGMPE